MSLFSGFDGTVGKLRDKIIGTEMLPRLTMRCCMLGARGVGKTSVITSLYNSQKKAVADTKLFLTPDAATQQTLDNKRVLLQSMFRGLHSENELVSESGLPGDSTESIFKFTYGMNSENINIDLEIRDYPGEYLRKEPGRVAEFVKEADAIIIAIDTPCLIESNGKYHEGKNRPRLVTEFLSKYLTGDSEKLVMFVPLKCEKYFLDNRVEEITAKIETEYAELISNLRHRRNEVSGKKNVCCVIAPIQTLGGIAFDSFSVDDNGATAEIFTRDNLPLPDRINFKYISSDASYSPQFCEQPLYFLLAFISKQYEKAKEQYNDSGLLGRLWKILRLIPNIEAFQLEIAMLGQRRLTDVHGYKVLCGRGKI